MIQNILCYALDPAYPEHEKLKDLLLNLSPENRITINPTILYETYHSLVYGQKWLPSEAEKRLKMLLKHPYIEFHSQTKRTCTIALSLAATHKLGGRDALIIANLITNKIPTFYTHDQEILNLKKLSWRNYHIKFKDPHTREIASSQILEEERQSELRILVGNEVTWCPETQNVRPVNGVAREKLYGGDTVKLKNILLGI